MNTHKFLLCCSVVQHRSDGGQLAQRVAMSREKLTEGDAQPDRNGGQDTAEHDLVIYRDMVLVNQPHQRKCVPPVNVLHLLPLQRSRRPGSARICNTQCNGMSRLDLL